METGLTELTELPAAARQRRPTNAPTLAEIEAVAVELMASPQVEMPVTDHFAPGVYLREFVVPAGTFVIGHIHKHEHLNVILSGRMTVLCDGRVQELKAPMIFKSGPNIAKVAVVHEELRYATIHPLAGLEHCGQDADRIVQEICVFTEGFKQKQAEISGRRRASPSEERLVA